MSEISFLITFAHSHLQIQISRVRHLNFLKMLSPSFYLWNDFGLSLSTFSLISTLKYIFLLRGRCWGIINFRSSSSVLLNSLEQFSIININFISGCFHLHVRVRIYKLLSRNFTFYNLLDSLMHHKLVLSTLIPGFSYNLCCLLRTNKCKLSTLN